MPNISQPEGGVKEGQVFLSPIEDTFKGPHLDIPTGSWKDPLFACCRTGRCPPCHPHVLCACLCPQVLMAQVMTRLQLTWLGEPGPMISTRNTFNIVVTIIGCYFVYSTMLAIYSMPYDVNTVPPFVPVLKALGSLLFSVWSFYSLCKTRENTRARYSIPEERCHGCEDCCCALFCTCCTVAQMARHTGDYENYPGTCCTSTGLPSHAPLAV
jgi:Cys-rich protein (TIGR01571 family)